MRTLNFQTTLLRTALCCLLLIGFSGCNKQSTLDYNHPEVNLFVKQLKAGKYNTENNDILNSMPKFTMEDIGTLLKHADDLTLISSFPLAPVSYAAGGKLRLGECLLWTVESIRLGHKASMGCKMVHDDADNYEGIYFLSDEEVLDAVQHYMRWWDNRKYPRTMWTVDPCNNEPLCGSGYMWW
jgi:hypothetical protein